MSNPPKESIEAGEWKRSTNFMEHPVFHRWSCICDTLHDLVPSAQFKKREKHPWRSDTFTKSNTHLWVLLTFFKMYKWYQTAQRTTCRLFYFHVIFVHVLERAARVALARQGLRLYTKSFSLTYTRTKSFYLKSKPNKYHAVF